MYTAYNLKLETESFDNSESYILIGKQRIKNLKADAKTELEKFILPDGSIDGTSLSDEWFQKIQSDIFISHSHNDENLAYILAGWLKNTFGLNVFIDEAIWGSADELLRAIDDKYCWKQQSKTYSYEKRNLTTSHIHAMLATSIYSVMDRTEVVFFLNTEESIPKIENVINEDSSYTLSPWIYEEIMATKLLRIRDWREYREHLMLEHSFRTDTADAIPKIRYEIPLNHLNELDTDTLCLWEEKYQSRGTDVYRGFPKMSTHPLNYLYDIVSGKHE